MKFLAILLLAATGANAAGLERLHLQMRSMPGAAALPTAGMQRLKVSSRDNAKRMKAEVRKIERGLTISKTGFENDAVGAKISTHLLNNGEEAFDLFDQPAKCLNKTRTNGRDGVEMLACQQFAMMAPEGKTVHHAVLRHAIGDITVYHETWTKDDTGIYMIEQVSYRMSANGELKEAMRVVLAAGEDEVPVPVAAGETLNVHDAQVGAQFRAVAGEVLRTMPRTEI